MNTKNKIFVGIDVSKATLDISVEGRHFKIKNNPESIHCFINKELILKDNFPSLVCLESTGGYEKFALNCFADAEIPLHRAHPNKVHFFAKASGHFAKTDKLDAKLLEKYARFVSDTEKGDPVISKATYELQGLRSIEKNIMESLHAYQCRIKMISGIAIDHYKSHIKFLGCIYI